MSYPTISPHCPSVGDATLRSVDALGASAGATNGTGLDLGPITGPSSRTELAELKLSAPALDATQLPANTTMTYKIQAAALSNFSGAVTLADAVIVQTGAANTGAAAAASCRLKLPSNCPQYVRAVATGGTNSGNCALATMALEVLF